MIDHFIYFEYEKCYTAFYFYSPLRSLLPISDQDARSNIKVIISQNNFMVIK